jgi:1-deoxy-D-xylulose-5-phosphate synthase
MTAYLDQLESSQEIKSFSNAQLTELAVDCRKRIIDVVSKTGGHLASSLGVVDLTVALAKIFDFEKDKIIWDVGHQAYAYKLLTGRRDQFDQLGKKGGIAKFLRRSESKFDHFGAGHASTSISAALGISTARALKNDEYKTIAVIGDGAMTGGLAFEALNHAGHLNQNLIVIFNDNKMSIDPVVGALSKTIINISSSKSFNKIRNEISLQSKQKKLPLTIVNGLKRLNESFMAFFTQGVWFEKLNFRYFGVIDGHNIKDLVSLLKVTRKVEGPVLLHISTQKGKGYSYAEGNAPSYHGVGAFEIDSGKPLASTQNGISYTQLWCRSFGDILAKDEKAIGISAAMLANTGLLPLEQKYPERIFDVGIAEGHGVTFAAGLSTQGIKPFVVIYSTFLQRAFDHIVHDVALQNLPVKFILDRAGFVGADGATHHGAMDLSYLRMIPNMVILSPKDGKEFQQMITLVHNYNAGPIALRFPRGNTTEYYEKDASPIPAIPFGRGELLQKGSDFILIAIGTMVNIALEVALELEKDGISVGVINARFVKPLDQELILQEVKIAKVVVTLEENMKAGGFGSGVMELIQEHNIYKPVICLGMPDRFIEYATPQEQLEEAGLDAPSIIAQLRTHWDQSQREI